MLFLGTMNSPTSYHLTFRQIGRLALSMSVLYMPLRMYALIPDIRQQLSWERVPLWTMEFIVIALFFFIWIFFIEWLQNQLFDWFGTAFLMEFKIPIQVATFIIACVMALIFNIGFRFLWTKTETALETRFGIVQRQTKGNVSYRNFRQLPLKNALNALTIMALLSAFYLASYRRAYLRLKDAEFKAEQMEKLHLKMQNIALRNQVSPHFLFNNFSILASLVETQPQLSVQFIHHLSKAYRYILEQSMHERISLHEELDFLNTYTFLLKMRFEERFQVNIHISEKEANNYFIAPLTLQLLVENAVKHNQMSLQEPLIVMIDMLENYLMIHNSIRRRQVPEPSTRLGLQNIIERYRLLTNSPVLIEETEDVFVVKIPILS